MTFKNYPKTLNKATPDGMLSKVIKLGFPVAIQSALVAILALADVLMVSDFGKEATASVGIASKWHFVAIMIMAGMASANGVLVAQYWGRNDRITAKTITMLAMRCGAKILLPVTLIITLGSSYIMMLQTSDARVIELGATYLWYSFPVLILTHLIVVAESAMRSSGDTVTPLFLGAVTIFVNIGLNFWLIKGGVGIPAMGVAGAALATTISRLLQVVLMFGFLNWRKHWLITSQTLTESTRLWASYKRLAIPTTASAVMWATGTLMYQMIFGHMGTTELAVFSMIGPFESLCYSLFFGISVACSILLGQSLGRDEFADAFKMSKFFIKTVLGFGLTVGGVLLFGKDMILSWLNLTSAELYPLASPALSVLCCAIWLRMLNMIIINGILRAGGDNQFCLRMDFISMWLVGVPLTALAAFGLGWDFKYVYMLMLVEEVVKFSLCFHRYLKRHWMNNLTLPASA
ncbi:MATE family efflux transporter [Vibrio genomosp. F6]|uniref:Multidrug resistance protein NorM n=1 Tax=Vibrio genomosp. F6 str. FF-238 TaxID=1191298 RepID=A0A1E5CS31_9VIBR|nr:MATE family efflux transporter [Vibrio genomosp. F6]OEE72723.1 MATE family efflux transporter [Vibrio genomosp. F6 str. FF-238]